MAKKKEVSNTHAVYFIKPEGMNSHRMEIRERIWTSGLIITVCADVVVSGKMVDRFFPNLSSDILAVAKNYLVGKRCELGIIEGEDAIEKLRSICGGSSNPNECAQGTIRHDFGSRIPFIAGIRGYYWKDVLYYSQSKKDVARDLVLARKLLNDEEV